MQHLILDLLGVFQRLCLCHSYISPLSALSSQSQGLNRSSMISSSCTGGWEFVFCRHSCCPLIPCYITSPEHYVGRSADFLTICSEMTPHLHLALQQLTLWFICQLLLSVPPAVPLVYTSFYVAPWLEITVPRLLFRLRPASSLVSSPDSLM